MSLGSIITNTVVHVSFDCYWFYLSRPLPVLRNSVYLEKNNYPMSRYVHIYLLALCSHFLYYAKNWQTKGNTVSFIAIFLKQGLRIDYNIYELGVICVDLQLSCRIA
jgi:hypothetical protein